MHSTSIWLRRVIGSLAAIGVMTAFARAAVVTIPDVQATVGQTSITIPVYVSGGEAVSDAQVILQVGNGGTVTGNPQVPEISEIRTDGSIFVGLPSGFGTTSAFPPPDEIVDLQIVANANDETVAATGTLVTFTLDLTTTSLRLGDRFELSLTDVFGTQTELYNPQDTVVTTLDSGSITLIPEPASYGLLVAILLYLHRRRPVHAASGHRA